MDEDGFLAGFRLKISVAKLILHLLHLATASLNGNGECGRGFLKSE